MQTKHRSTLTEKGARRFVGHWNNLLHQLNDSTKRPTGLFIDAAAMGITVNTLMNRLSDSLLWLRQNQLNGNTFKPSDYETLFACIRKQSEATGIRIRLLASSIELAIRPTGEPEQPTDWKTNVTNFLIHDSDKLVMQFKNCLLSVETIKWLDLACKNAGAENLIEGDTVTVVKEA